MKQQLCANCGDRPPFFRVKGGPIKLDSKHSLCKACYRNQQNSMHAQSKKKCTCEQFGNGVVSGEVDPPAPPGCLLDPYCPRHGKSKSMHNNIKEVSWEDRHYILEKIIKSDKLYLKGTDLPDPEDPSDPSFEVSIYIGDTGAGTEALYGDKLVGTGIPSLMIPQWNKKNLKYLKHWLFKVLDDPKVYRATRIKVEASGSWQKAFK